MSVLPAPPFHQKGLFLLKKRCAAAVFLLKRFMIELIEPFKNRLVQLRQRKEFPVSQSSEDVCGDYSNCPLDHCFILGGSHAARQDSGIVMLCKLGIGFVKLDLILAVLIYTGFEIALTALCTLCDESAQCKRRRCSILPTPLLNLRGRGAQFRATYSIHQGEKLFILIQFSFGVYRRKKCFFISRN